MLCLVAALVAAPAVIPATTSSMSAHRLFRQAQELVDNARLADATVALENALSVDPGFASAKALLASITPPPGNDALMQAALAEAASLPAAERAQIELLAAQQRGDDAKSRELRRKIIELAPDDWRGYFALGGEAIGDRAWERAVAALTRATQLNGKAAGAWNLLGYAYMMQKKYDDAITTLRKYAEVAPREPNAHDSLGEALLNANRLAEAEAEFRKAAEMDPHFVGAWMAIAETRFLRNDWEGGLEALRSEKKAARRPADAANADLMMATALYTEGSKNAAGAFAAARANAAKAGVPQRYFADATHALFLEMDGKPAEALKLADAGLAELAASDLPASTKDNFSRGILSVKLRAEAQLGDSAAAQKTFARLEELSQPLLKQAFAASAYAEAKGLLRLAEGNAKQAAAEMSACLDVDLLCQMHRIRAQELAGDTAGAQASRAQVLETPLRGLNYVYAFARLTKQKLATN